MSTTKKVGPVIELGLCRCCSTMKRCRFLNVEYQYLGSKEIYSEMIMDCFGLLISYMDSKPTERLICATCVTRLREAVAFRKQVLLCEEAFLNMKIVDHCDAPSTLICSSEDPEAPKMVVEVKMEADDDPDPFPADHDALGDNEDHTSSTIERPLIINEDSTSNDDMPLNNLVAQRNQQSPEKPNLRPEKPNTRPVKPITRPEKPNTRPEKPDSRAEKLNSRSEKHKSRSEKLNARREKPNLRPGKAIIKSRSKNLRQDSILNTSKTSTVPKQLIKDKVDISTSVDRPPKMPMSMVQEMMRERDPTYMSEINILTIIEYSYACPFKCRHNNLICYYCGEYFSKPELLREHTELKHNPKKFKINDKLMIKVDLTRVDCRLCDTKIDNLNTFKEHLTSAHKKKYYFNHKDSILPFKLDKELKCAVCEMKFQYFHALNKHMNVHFSNYVCETCGLGFVDRGRFLMHQQRHEIGDFPCEKCGKVFKAQYNRDLHIDRVHEKRARVYCPKCDVKLMTYHHKLKHLVEVHGEEPLSFPCDMCERVFTNRRMLTVHRRKEHLKDFRYECTFCGQKFFTRFALTNHTPTHTLERNFQCQVCEKAYPRLKTLKDHMRIHTNDRRYRCQICGQGFIQNCSLKGHMKSQHPEYG